ncbi:class I SAM-dependent methyltransferase [Candidatus Woesearchaeota archaeon]|nr:class I SAM-dependent methyltransferase [Candidatus Woesearchaeota archaeon]
MTADWCGEAMGSNEWDEHWSSRKFVSLNFAFKFYRKHVMSNALSYFFEKYFPKDGIFVECGSGTSLTSFKVMKHKRRLIALDLSIKAIMEARKIRKIDYFVQSDILRLPFKPESVDGIWNLGVMEHLTQAEIDKAMGEFQRVLKKGSYVVLFWPPVYSSTGIAYRIIEKMIKIATGKDFRFYPDEISRLSSREEGASIMKRNGFRDCRVFFPWRNCFGDLVVVAKK